MKTHQVNLNNGQTIYGLLSRVNVPDRVFYLFNHDAPQLGMIGKEGDGTAYSFDDCESVYAETKPGVFNSDEQIQAWIRWWRDRP
jgi:hypothetical protein